MTEEINYSYDGGLYAELVRNRTFRSDWSGILNWFLIEKGSSSAKITVDSKEGPSKAITNSAKLEVTRADANSPAGLLNEGYWGIAVRPNSRYTGSLFAKTGADGSLPLKVALVADVSGQVLGQRIRSGRRNCLEGVQVRNAVRKRGGVFREPFGDHDRQARDPVAATGLRVSADVQRPVERQPDRHHGEAGRHAPFVPALPGRQLPGRRPHRRPLRLEEDDRPAGGPADSPDHLELPLFRRHGPAGVSDLVRGSAHGTRARRLCRVLSGRAGGQARPGSRSLRTGSAGGDRVRHRRNRYEVGRGARPRRPSGSLQAALRGSRQRRQLRPGQDLRRPLRAVLQGDQGEISRIFRSLPRSR